VSKKKIPPTLHCGLDLLSEVLYGKWKMRLLYFIHEGHKRPSELHRKIPDASLRVLTAQLRELEMHMLVTKVIYPQVPPKVKYSLTELGESLVPVINTLGLWADEHQEVLREVIGRESERSTSLKT
jgi:DNA-binding HxlR family transcriptional regulator